MNIGPQYSVYIIAEGGVSHGGDIAKACDMLIKAQEAGANAFKVQAFDPDKMDPFIFGSDVADRMRPKRLDSTDILLLQERADELGIDFLCTAHDAETAKWVRDVLKPPAFKLGSLDVLIDDIVEVYAGQGKPVFLSEGVPFQEHDPYEILGKAQTYVIPLHCVSEYPTALVRAKMLTLNNLYVPDGRPYGYSDHTGHLAPIGAAVTLRASVIEAHINHPSYHGSRDKHVGWMMDDFHQVVDMVRDTEACLP